MQVMPFEISPGVYNVFVALEDKNIERMKKYDPAQFDATKLPEQWQAKKLNVVIIGYATKDDLMQVRSLIERGAPAAALEFLSRGFAFRPDKGDSDERYREP